MNLRSTALLMAAVMCSASIAGVAARPDIKDQPNFLEKTVPLSFGEWTKLPESPQIVNPSTAALLAQIYPETLSRTYVDRSGYKIMLSLARSGNQIGIQQAHFPEICYQAQGFKVGDVEVGELATPFGPISVSRLETRMGTRYEPVMYWLTMGNEVVRTSFDKRLVQIRAVITGESPGGLLFRVSSIDGDAKRAFAKQQKFVADMMNAVSAESRQKLSGLPPKR